MIRWFKKELNAKPAAKRGHVIGSWAGKTIKELLLFPLYFTRTYLKGKEVKTED